MSSERNAERGRISDLRAKADLYRYAASIPSFGGSEADRVLVLAAERLEWEAAALESAFSKD